MAITATEMETMRDALIRARAKGVRELQMGGERLKYGSDAEMAAAITDLDARLRSLSSRRPSTIAFRSSKGL